MSSASVSSGQKRMYAQGTSLDRESASSTSTSVAKTPQNTSMRS